MQALWQWWGAQASPKKKKKKEESGGSRESAELQERRRPKGRERTGRSEMTLCKHPCNDGHRRLKPRMYVWFFLCFPQEWRSCWRTLWITCPTRTWDWRFVCFETLLSAQTRSKSQAFYFIICGSKVRTGFRRGVRRARTASFSLTRQAVLKLYVIEKNDINFQFSQFFFFFLNEILPCQRNIDFTRRSFYCGVY